MQLTGKLLPQQQLGVDSDKSSIIFVVGGPRNRKAALNLQAIPPGVPPPSVRSAQPAHCPCGAAGDRRVKLLEGKNHIPSSLGRFVALVTALALATGCSPSTQNPAAPGAPSSSASASAPTIATGTVCELKLLTGDDLTGIFDEPFTGTKPLPGDAQTCYFVTAEKHQLRVTLRPGHGRAAIGSFTSGRMNDYAKWQPLAGVGEEAVWKPDLTEVSARHGDVLCEIAPEAGGLFLSKNLKSADVTAKQQKFGALCNTIFARLHLSGATTIQTKPISKRNGGNVVEAACEKDVTPSDIADIITAPVIKQAAVLNPQSCSYHAAAGATLTISLAQGADGKTLWDVLATNAGAWSPLSGVGDSAMHAREGTLVLARSGELVCDVDISGTDNADGMQVITKARGEDLADKLAALCGKVFASRR